MGQKKAYIEVVKENEVPCEVVCDIEDVINDEDKGFRLCFQKCIFHYDSGTSEHGYRFIRRKPDGTLQASRGQACIPTVEMALRLINKAIEAGWAEIRYERKQ